MATIITTQWLLNLYD